QREGVFLPLPATPVLAHGQPRVGNAAGKLLGAEADQYDIAGALLGVGAASAGLQILAEMVDPQDETADLLGNCLEDVHQRLTDGVVVLLPGPTVAGTGSNGVDDNQPQRQAVLGLQ